MDIYQKLKKIKTPVLIEVVQGKKPTVRQERFRILYPDGKCEYSPIVGGGYDLNGNVFFNSCFAIDYTSWQTGKKFLTLEETVNEMKAYDEGYLKIVKVQPL